MSEFKVELGLNSRQGTTKEKMYVVGTQKEHKRNTKGPCLGKQHGPRQPEKGLCVWNIGADIIDYVME